MLTAKQRNLLLLIDSHLKRFGIVPSFDEMKDALGLRSKSGVHRLISSLEERGFIRRLPHRARALEIIKLPEDMAAAPVEAAAFQPTVIAGGFRKQIAGAAVASGADAVSIPLYGKIAAGTPIEALADLSASVDVPASMLTGGEHYALTIEGDSMIEAGIFDGDTVLIRKTDTVENGAIVVALVDQNEATLKRLRRKGESIALEPANPRYETRIFGPDRVSVQGRLVGLIRRY
ncbi:transcriptional repressor LexA [Oleispirillum naphthae]|uniref:transcriptional repressor LexA n=1 Tax=Oleispirillum naphthae TaxID=2838853 RepID=UPI00308241AB